MWFTGLVPLVWRTSATFVHDWLALAMGIALTGHIAMAFAHPEARKAMRTGLADRDVGTPRTPLVGPAGRRRRALTAGTARPPLVSTSDRRCGVESG